MTTGPVHYERLPMRVSFAFAADSGFARTTGSTLLVLGSGDVPEVGALRQLVGVRRGTGRRRSSPSRSPWTSPASSSPRARRWGTEQQLPAALLAGQPLGDVGSAPLGLSAPDGRTFVVRADDFTRLRGLDVLLDNELELADLGLRLRAMDPDAAVDLLPAARVRRVCPAEEHPLRGESSGIHRAPWDAAADPGGHVVPARCSGHGVAGDQQWPYAVRAVVQPEDGDAGPSTVLTWPRDR